MDSKKKKRENGFSAAEMLTVILVATIVLALVLSIAFQVSGKQKFKVFQYNANVFARNAVTYALNYDKDTIYLQSLIDQQLTAKVKNPFAGEKYCDTYASKVILKEEKQYVTLQCGNYLIEEQNASADRYTIYKISDWTTQKRKNSDYMSIEKKELYNYQINGKKVLDTDQSKEVFLYLFNQINHTGYESIEQIPTQYQVKKKTYYRSKIKMTEIKNKKNS